MNNTSLKHDVKMLLFSLNTKFVVGNDRICVNVRGEGCRNGGDGFICKQTNETQCRPEKSGINCVKI